MQWPAVKMFLSEMMAPPHMKASDVNIAAIHGYLCGVACFPLTILPTPLTFDSPQAGNQQAINIAD